MIHIKPKSAIVWIIVLIITTISSVIIITEIFQKTKELVADEITYVLPVKVDTMKISEIETVFSEQLSIYFSTEEKIIGEKEVFRTFDNIPLLQLPRFSGVFIPTEYSSERLKAVLIPEDKITNVQESEHLIVLHTFDGIDQIIKDSNEFSEKLNGLQKSILNFILLIFCLVIGLAHMCVWFFRKMFSPKKL